MKKIILSLFSMLLLATTVSWGQNVNIIDFKGSDITDGIRVDNDRLVRGSGSVDLEWGSYSLPFSETKLLFENAAGDNKATLKSRSAIYNVLGGFVFDASANNSNADAINNGSIITEPIAFERKPSLEVNNRFRYETNEFGQIKNSTRKKVFLTLIWPKELFLNGANGSTVAFDAASAFDMNTTETWDAGEWSERVFRYVIKNGNTYYISNQNLPDAKPAQLSDFNNSDTRKWLPYNPESLTVPTDFSEAVAVNFNDVQAVGFTISARHDWSRSFSFNAFTVTGVKVNPAASPDLLVYEGFDYPAMIGERIVGDILDGGLGWDAKWGSHGSGNMGIGAEGLMWGDLASSGTAAAFLGGSTWGCGIGRRMSMGFPGSDAYVSGGLFSKGTVWVSALMNPSHEESLLILSLSNTGWDNSIKPQANVGIIYNNRNTDNGYEKSTNWQIHAGENDGVIEITDIPAAIGEASLVVAKIEFDAAGGENGGKITLFVNPDITLSDPTGGYEVTTTQNLRFRHFMVGCDGAENSMIDEFRLGKTYASVVPAAPKPSFSISSWERGLGLDQAIEITYPTMLFKPGSDYEPLEDSDLVGMVSMKSGSREWGGNYTSFTATVSGNKITITPNGDWGYDKEYTVEIAAGKAVDAFNTYVGGGYAESFRTVPNKQPLADMLGIANALYASATEGTATDQYDAGSKAIFQTAIDAGNAVLADYAERRQSENQWNEALSIEGAVYELKKAIYAFSLTKVGSNEQYVVFSEGFKFNGWHEWNTYADESQEFDNSGKGNYIHDRIFICSNWNDAKTWAWASGGSNLNLSDDGRGATTLNIKNINTTLVTNPTLSLAQCWDDIIVSYSTNSTIGSDGDWTVMTGRTQVAASGDWGVFEYNDVLPSSANLWIKIEKEDKNAGITLIDDVIVKGDGIVPVISYNNIANDAVRVEPDVQIYAISSLPLVKTPDLSAFVTDPSDAYNVSLFELREQNASGAIVPITVSPMIAGGLATEFTLIPTSSLNPGAVYYLSMKARASASAIGVRTALAAPITFRTQADTLALHDKVYEIQALFDAWTTIPAEGTNEGDLIPGSTDRFLRAFDNAVKVMRAERSLQPEVDAQLLALEAAWNRFYNHSILLIDRSTLEAFIEIAEADLSNPAYAEGDLNGDHTTGSHAAYWQAVNKAKYVYNDPNAELDEFKVQILALIAAGEAFELAIVEVDYDALEAAIDIAKGLIDPLPVEANKHGDYITGSTNALSDAIEDAEEVYGNNRMSQRHVDDALLALNEATIKFEKSIVVVDFAALEKLVNEAQAVCDAAVEGVRNGDYTATAISDFNALIAAKSAKINTAVSSATIAADIDDLTDALAAFRDADIKVDYSELSGLIQDYSLLLGSITEGDRAGDYASGTKNEMLLVINAAKLVRDDSKATQAEVAAAIATLEASKTVLDGKVVTVDTDALSTAITAAEANLIGKVEGLSNGNQKSGSIDTYEEAIARAKDARDNAKATQVSLDNAEAWLAVATANFDSAIVVVDYSLLNAAILNAEALVATDNYEDRYSESSRDTFEAVLGDATDLAAVEDDTQADVDAALSALRAAQNGLVVNSISADNAGLGILTVYPNPAESFIMIGEVSNVDVKIYTTAGELVMVYQGYSAGTSIDVTSLTSGNYVVVGGDFRGTLIKK